MDRRNDPVWQAFERAPSALTEDDVFKTQRGLEQVRKGMFVDVESKFLKLKAQ